MPDPALVASVLNADLARLGPVCAELEDAGLDAIQWDVMDGHFVPNLTVGWSVIAAAREATTLPFEVHLMVDNPDPFLAHYAEAGCETLIVHAETTTHLHRTLAQIRELPAGAGVALNPATPLSAIESVIDLVDLLLVMTVNPGFGGQSYIATMEPKIRAARELISSTGRDIALEVDGGINPDTVAGAAGAGADRFIVGSALWRGNSPGEVVTTMRDQIKAEIAP